MKIFAYTVIFEPAEEGGYIVHVPVLNGLATQGETYREAKAMARDAIQGYIETLRDLGQPIPMERASKRPRLEKLAVSL